MRSLPSTMSYLELLKLAFPEVIVVISALVVLASGLTSRQGTAVAGVSSAKPPTRAAGTVAITDWCSSAAALGVVIAIAAVLMLPRDASLFGGMLVITPLTSLFKIICLVLAFFTVCLARSEKSLRHPGEYLAIVLLATVGLMLLVGSEELLMIFIGLELLGLSLYVMAAFDKTDVRSAEAGLKYFLFGSTSSAFTLFGISLIYGMSGSTGLAAVSEKLAAAPAQPLLAAGMIMTLIGFAFKIAAAPFHLWAPDAYQGAPIPSAAFIASGSKVASFVVLGKIVLVGFGPVHGSSAWHAMAAGWSPILAALAALSILIGNLVALAQTNVRRVHGYFHVFSGRYPAVGRIFREVLPVQRCAARRWRSRLALAGWAGALRQFCLALLLPDCAQSDFCRPAFGFSSTARSRVVGFASAKGSRCACWDRSPSRYNARHPGGANSCGYVLKGFSKKV